MAADNQQERLDNKWISGFVDGEGCFHVSINKQPKMSLGWQVLPEFRVVQHKRDENVLQQMQKTFGCGQVVVNHEDRKELRIRGLENLNRVVKFFSKYELRTMKRKDFEIFAKIISLMNDERHLTRGGLREIAELASKMNRQVRKKYLESSETIRPTP